MSSFHNDKFLNLGEWFDQNQLQPRSVTQDIVSVYCGGVWATTGSQIAKHGLSESTLSHRYFDCPWRKRGGVANNRNSLREKFMVSIIARQEKYMKEQYLTNEFLLVLIYYYNTCFCHPLFNKS
jgi:hypothetical protein